MNIFRSQFIQPKTIAVFPNPIPNKFSLNSIVWLNSLQNPNIKHAKNNNNGKEVRICNKKVDGYDATTRICYKYLGCFWHGCPKCYNPETKNNVNKQKMEDLYHKTLEKIKKLGTLVLT